MFRLALVMGMTRWILSTAVYCALVPSFTASDKHLIQGDIYFVQPTGLPEDRLWAVVNNESTRAKRSCDGWFEHDYIGRIGRRLGGGLGEKFSSGTKVTKSFVIKSL